MPPRQRAKCFTSIDAFAGGGGASEGILRAMGVAPQAAINHDQAAIIMHAANHPGTMHMCEDVFAVQPFRPYGQELDLFWLSPDCSHFSRAKGGKPRSAKIRALAWVAVHWASHVKPRVIGLENVPEFLTWGPLYTVTAILELIEETLGRAVHRDGLLDDDPDSVEFVNEWAENVSLPKHARVGQPISEKKGEIFCRFVEDLEDLGYEVEWKVLCAADYGAPTTRKRLFLIARCDDEPITWPTPSHGPGRALPYKTAAECIDWDIPCHSIFLTKAKAKAQGLNVRRPLADKTMARIAEGVRRFVVETDDPFILQPTVGGLIPIPCLINTRNGERRGQAPRVRSVRRPYLTVTSKGSQGGLVMAFLAKHYTGVYGQPLNKPLGTITAKDHHSLVYAFLMKYYGTGGQLQSLNKPMHTIVSKARFGLITVHIKGQEYAIVDIGMRMLVPRELARAQGFQDSYKLTGTKTQQIARIGNSVPPPPVKALVQAQFRPPRRARARRRVRRVA